MKTLNNYYEVNTLSNLLQTMKMKYLDSLESFVEQFFKSSGKIDLNSCTVLTLQSSTDFFFTKSSFLHKCIWTITKFTLTQCLY